MSFESLQRSLPGRMRARELDSYYDGDTRLDALGVSLPPEMRILEMVVPWPRLAVDVLVEVLTFIGYTLGDDPDDDRLKYLKKAYDANSMDTLIRLGLTDSLVQGGAYWLVGPGNKYPKITTHAASDVAVEHDIGGDVAEALVRWRVGPASGDRRLSHYVPGRTDVYAPSRAGWDRVPELSVEDTELDAVPVVPMLNKARTSDMRGRSEMDDVITMANAGSRSLTNLQVAQELEALPKRWIFANGVGEAFEKSGKSKLDTYMGYLNFGPEGGKVQQLNGAALDPIINSFKLYAMNVSSVTGIPPSMLGISTDNPSSAEAMRVAKERLSSRGEAKQSMFGDALEDLARMVLLVGDHSDEDLEVLETVWRDVATPSRSSQQSMALQAFQSGAISAQTMRDFLDLTPSQRQREDMRDIGHAGMPSREVKSVSESTRSKPVDNSGRPPAKATADDANSGGR